MLEIKEMLDRKIAERVKQRDRLDILFITDADSRLYNLRGITAMEDFVRYYQTISDVSLVTMGSDRVNQLQPDLSKFTVVWVDNVANPALSRYIDAERERITELVVPHWKDGLDELEAECDKARAEYAELMNKVNAEIEQVSDNKAAVDAVMKKYQAKIDELTEKSKAADTYREQVAEYRAISSTRFIYALDEFIWEGPGRRQNNVMYVKVVEDLIVACDELVVPNAQMAQLIGTFNFIGKKPTAVVPSFMSERFYPVHKIFKKSNSGVSSIRKPKILIKGLVIPDAIQSYIYYNYKNADITISTGGVLQDRVYELVVKREVKNIVHWSNLASNSRNVTTTLAYERDVDFDFVILTMMDDPSDSIYTVADVDIDALQAVACGSVVLAQIDDIGYAPGMHICKETGLSFGKDITTEKFAAMITKWSKCVNWDNAHEKQRKLLDTRMVNSTSVMGGFYGAMTGKPVSEQRNEVIKKLIEAENTPDAK